VQYWVFSTNRYYVNVRIMLDVLARDVVPDISSRPGPIFCSMRVDRASGTQSDGNFQTCKRFRATRQPHISSGWLAARCRAQSAAVRWPLRSQTFRVDQGLSPAQCASIKHVECMCPTSKHFLICALGFRVCAVLCHRMQKAQKRCFCAQRRCFCVFFPHRKAHRKAHRNASGKTPSPGTFIRHA
jgi:hypothetical protein